MTEKKVVQRMFDASSWQLKSSSKVTFFSYYHCSFVNFETCQTYVIMNKLKKGSKYNCREHLLKKSERFCAEAMSIAMVMKWV